MANKKKSKKPSFFKIMFGDFTNTLRIPLAFTRHLKSNLDTKYVLEVPDGSRHYVEVEKFENDFFFFRDGWPRFAETNSLEFGDVLVFTYAGDSKFSVRIYGKTCCEKDTNLGGHVNQKKPSVIHESNFSSQRKIPPPTSTKRKDRLESPIGRKLVSAPQDSHSRASAGGNWCGISPGMRKRAIEAADEFKSNNPFWRVVLTRTYIYRSFMHVPAKLVRCLANTSSSNEVSERGMDVRLHVSGVRMWQVRLTCLRNKAYFCKGWKAFVKDNYLAVGDVCIFELIKEGELDLKVLSYRLTQQNKAPSVLENVTPAAYLSVN